jgi:uncharacterized protein YfaS (alpha-2-macroglobulin family)
VLERLGQAYAKGIDVPQDEIKSALKYVTANVSFDSLSLSEDSVSQALYTAKVLSYYPKTWYNYDIGRIAASADKFGRYMTPLGKAYMASIYASLGSSAKAKDYLDQLFETAQTSPVMGTYWAPQERSWLWFNDSITTHVAAIDALLAVNPQDLGRLNGLVKWLMFDSKATSWTNPEDGAKAVYAMINIMSKEGELEKLTNYKIDWNGLKEVAVVEPMSPATKEISFAKYAPEVSEGDFTASVEKISSVAKASSLDDYATLTALFTAPTPTKSSPESMLNIDKTYYIIKGAAATPLNDGDTVSVGDEIRVKLSVTSQADFDFVYINDPKPAAFETDKVNSGWEYDYLRRYEEYKDASTNFYMMSVPNGIYELNYTIRPTAAGTFSAGAAVIQSMFAPEFAAHSAGITLKVK